MSGSGSWKQSPAIIRQACVGILYNRPIKTLYPFVVLIKKLLKQQLDRLSGNV